MQSSQRVHKQQCARIRRQASQCDTDTFFNALTAPDWFDQVESLIPEHRERLFLPIETLSMFLTQALNVDRSCHSRWSVHWFNTRASSPVLERRRHGVGVVVLRVWCMAPPFPRQTRRQTSTAILSREARKLCLGSGVVLNAAIGPYRGKVGDEQHLLHSILDTLSSGDILIRTMVAEAALLTEQRPRQLSRSDRRSENLIIPEATEKSRYAEKDAARAFHRGQENNLHKQAGYTE